MATILQTFKKLIFLYDLFCICDLNFTEICSQGPINNEDGIGSINDLMDSYYLRLIAGGESKLFHSPLAQP